VNLVAMYTERVQGVDVPSSPDDAIERCKERFAVLSGPGHHYSVWRKDGREIAAVRTVAAANAVASLSDDCPTGATRSACFFPRRATSPIVTPLPAAAWASSIER
jgi:hypothetical protein